MKNIRNSTVMYKLQTATHDILMFQSQHSIKDNRLTRILKNDNTKLIYRNMSN